MFEYGTFNGSLATREDGLVTVLEDNDEWGYAAGSMFADSDGDFLPVEDTSPAETPVTGAVPTPGDVAPLHGSPLAVVVPTGEDFTLYANGKAYAFHGCATAVAMGRLFSRSLNI